MIITIMIANIYCVANIPDSMLNVLYHTLSNIFSFLKNIYFLCLFFWLHQVLVVVQGVFVEVSRIFRCSAGSSLWCTGFSLAVACGFSLSSCGAWAPGRVGFVVCGTQASLVEARVQAQ